MYSLLYIKKLLDPHIQAKLQNAHKKPYHGYIRRYVKVPLPLHESCWEIKDVIMTIVGDASMSWGYLAQLRNNYFSRG